MIIFTGDLHLGNSFITINKVVKERLLSANYMVSNFESVLNNPDFEKRKDKSSILSFKQNAFDNYISMVNTNIIFTMGNNHMHDFGQDGINTTESFLKNYSNVSITGIGALTDLYKPLIINDNGKKIALLTLSTDEPEVMSVLATPELKGVLNINDCKIPEIIKHYKEKVDYFIILPHWGKEYIGYPSVQQRKKAYEWIDAGADIIIGHHPHVIQGKEIYKEKCIYYSLGNYIFPEFYNKNGIKHEWSNKNSQSILLEISLNENININEVGLFFDIHNNELLESKQSLIEFVNRSGYLNTDRYSLKKYYGLWQKELFKILKFKYSLIERIRKLFPLHQDYGRISYFIKRIIRKIKIN